MDLLTKSKKELTRLEVMKRLQEKRLSQAEASGMLGVSVRQVKRLYAAYRKAGAQGLQCRHEVSQKAGGVVIPFVQRQPGDPHPFPSPAGGGARDEWRDPFADQRGFAEPGRG